MIRVNLLPHTGARRGGGEASQAWLLVILGLVVAEIVGLFFFHQTKEDELTAISNDVTALVSQINGINADVKDHQKVKQALDVLRAREDAITSLQAGRRGPTSALLELSRVLTRGKGPTLDPEKVSGSLNMPPPYNTNWDTRRLWLTRFVESDRTVLLEGYARDGSDVYEFAQRLKLSVYFDGVQLLPGQQESESKTKVDLVKFALEVKVRY